MPIIYVLRKSGRLVARSAMSSLFRSAAGIIASFIATATKLIGGQDFD
jgi:hypothetical protein